MTFIVSAGVLLLLHNIPISIVISGYIQDRKLLFYGVCRELLDCQPVQTLFPGKKNKYRFGTAIHNNHTEKLIPNLLINKVNIVFSLRLHILLTYWVFLRLF